MPEEKQTDSGQTKDTDNGGMPFGENQQPQLFNTYEDFFESLPEAHQNLITGDVTNLKSALQSERDSRKGLEQQLKNLADTLKGEPKERIDQLLTELEDTHTKAQFYEDAIRAGVVNLKLAYHIATSEGMFDRRNNVDFEALKADYPDLFSRKRVESKAGEGHETPPVPAGDFNTTIRRALGRK